MGIDDMDCPRRRQVLGIGMQVYTETDEPLLLAIDAVSW
jgi:hypothetical protein